MNKLWQNVWSKSLRKSNKPLYKPMKQQLRATSLLMTYLLIQKPLDLSDERACNGTFQVARHSHNQIFPYFHLDARTPRKEACADSVQVPLRKPDSRTCAL